MNFKDGKTFSAYVRSKLHSGYITIQNITPQKLDFAGDTRDKTVLTDHNHDCIFRECKKCGAVCFQEAIIEANINVDWEKICTWHRWENIEIHVPVEKQRNEGGNKEQKKKQFDKIRYTGTLAQLLMLFTKSIHNLSIHIFDFHWQAFQFDECKKLLQHGDVLMIMDFAQNHSHH